MFSRRIYTQMAAHVNKFAPNLNGPAILSAQRRGRGLTLRACQREAYARSRAKMTRKRLRKEAQTATWWQTKQRQEKATSKQKQQHKDIMRAKRQAEMQIA